MRNFKKITAVVLIAALMTGLAACGVKADPAEQSAALAALDMEMFTSSVTGDILSYNLTLKNPDALGIEKPQATWGDFSYEGYVEGIAQSEGWLERLNGIERSVLSESEQITYDTLKQMLESTLAYGESLYYYDEVLNPYNGLQTNLALNLIFYEIDSIEDIEDYLAFVADGARLMDDVLAFEQEKSKRGLFMTDDMLDEIQEQIMDFVDARETCYLLTTFDDMIKDVEMTDEQFADFMSRNETAVNTLIDGYQRLHDGLEQLRGTCTNEAGLCEFGDDGKRYFELGLEDAACMTITPEEAMTILEKELSSLLTRLRRAAANDSTVDANFGLINLSVGDTQKNLDYLETLMVGYYPELPEHTLTYINCPVELEDQFSPAAYLIPPVDDASENLIILNAKTMADETRYLDTLAHEGYPGHLYHYQYLRTLLDQTGYMRQNMSLTGYYEAWSQSGEVFFDSYNGEFSNDYCVYMECNYNLTGLIFPSIISIGVNYEGWTVSDVADFLSDYFYAAAVKEYKQIYFDEAVQNPFYFLEYALGFCYYQQQLRRAQSACGNSFDLLSYNETYLNIGPTYFNISTPIMDEWISEHSPKSAA